MQKNLRESQIHIMLAKLSMYPTPKTYLQYHPMFEKKFAIGNVILALVRISNDATSNSIMQIVVDDFALEDLSKKLQHCGKLRFVGFTHVCNIFRRCVHYTMGSFLIKKCRTRTRTELNLNSSQTQPEFNPNPTQTRPKLDRILTPKLT